MVEDEGQEPAAVPEGPPPDDLRFSYLLLTRGERVDWFRLLPKPEAVEFFLSLQTADQAALVLSLPPPERRAWLRLLDPDDAADLIQEAPEEEREGLLSGLDEVARREVRALLAFAEDDAGGLMNTRYARVRPDVSVDEALHYLRRQVKERPETIYYVYVLDAHQHLMGVVSLRDLFVAPPEKHVRDVMQADVVTAQPDMDQEALSRLFAEHDLVAIPVVDGEGRMKGIVTVDDIVDVVQEEATEDIQKIGGTQALDAPYLQTALPAMVRKRAVWLAVLFLGEMLTTSAMGFFEGELERALILAFFVPLIISSGGNAGSQASTLVIRAMALGEVRLLDWWRVMKREIAAGLLLGAILGGIGFVRVLAGEALGVGRPIGEHHALVGLVLAGSVVGVVTFGALAGSMLPFLLRRLGLDPASASAPFVATLVDVTGVMIYFGLAAWILSGTLLP